MPTNDVRHPSKHVLSLGTALLLVTLLLAACASPSSPTAPSISVSLSADTVTVGSTAQASAQVTIGGAAAAGAVLWSTADAGVASVNATGLVTGVAPGTTTIYGAYGPNPEVQGQAQVTVIEAPAVTNVVVTLANPDLRVGDTTQADAEVTAAGGAPTDVDWASADTAVATVDPTGRVTAVSPGSTQITATSAFDAEVSGSAAVAVAVPVTEITIGLDNAPFYLRGTSTVTASVIIEDVPTPGVYWTSDDESVFTVTPLTGELYAAGIGSATLTATSAADPSLSTDVQVTVVHPFADGAVAYYHQGATTREYATNILRAAVTDYGLTLLEVDHTDPTDAFLDAIEAGPDLVFYELRLPGDMDDSHLSALSDWVADGGHLIFTVGDGTLDGREELLATMGTSVAGAAWLLGDVIVLEPELAIGVDDGRPGSIGLDLSFEGEVYLLEALPGSVVWAHMGTTGTPPLVVASNEGRTVALGFPQYTSANPRPIEAFYENLFVRMLRSSLLAD